MNRFERMEAAGRPADETWRRTRIGRTADGHVVFEIPDIGFRLDPSVGRLQELGTRTAPLNRQFIHPGAQENYPGLASWMSALRIGPGVKEYGRTAPGSSGWVTVHAPDMATAEDVVMHELPHVFRNLEIWGLNTYPYEHFRRMGFSPQEAFRRYEAQPEEIAARNGTWRWRHLTEDQRRLYSPQTTERWMLDYEDRRRRGIK
jgi:hypothetical protein